VGGRDWRIVVQGQSGQKMLSRPYFQKNQPDVMVHTYNPNYAGTRGRMIVV
jgi:hypothetical protein